jgi:hypothetical protein
MICNYSRNQNFEIGNKLFLNLLLTHPKSVEKILGKWDSKSRKKSQLKYEKLETKFPSRPLCACPPQAGIRWGGRGVRGVLMILLFF